MSLTSSSSSTISVDDVNAPGLSSMSLESDCDNHVNIGHSGMLESAAKNLPPPKTADLFGIQMEVSSWH